MDQKTKEQWETLKPKHPVHLYALLAGTTIFSISILLFTPSVKAAEDEECPGKRSELVVDTDTCERVKDMENGPFWELEFYCKKEKETHYYDTELVTEEKEEEEEEVMNLIGEGEDESQDPDDIIDDPESTRETKECVEFVETVVKENTYHRISFRAPSALADMLRDRSQSELENQLKLNKSHDHKRDIIETTEYDVGFDPDYSDISSQEVEMSDELWDTKTVFGKAKLVELNNYTIIYKSDGELEDESIDYEDLDGEIPDDIDGSEEECSGLANREYVGNPVANEPSCTEYNYGEVASDSCLMVKKICGGMV